eukprot:Nk52_evm88s208 gene=Nk52_evmTU88s208
MADSTSNNANPGPSELPVHQEEDGEDEGSLLLSKTSTNASSSVINLQGELMEEEEEDMVIEDGPTRSENKRKIPPAVEEESNPPLPGAGVIPIGNNNNNSPARPLSSSSVQRRKARKYLPSRAPKPAVDHTQPGTPGGSGYLSHLAKNGPRSSSSVVNSASGMANNPATEGEGEERHRQEQEHGAPHPLSPRHHGENNTSSTSVTHPQPPPPHSAQEEGPSSDGTAPPVAAAAAAPVLSSVDHPSSIKKCDREVCPSLSWWFLTGETINPQWHMGHLKPQLENILSYGHQGSLKHTRHPLEDIPGVELPKLTEVQKCIIACIRDKGSPCYFDDVLNSVTKRWHTTRRRDGIPYHTKIRSAVEDALIGLTSDNRYRLFEVDPDLETTSWRLCTRVPDHLRPKEQPNHNVGHLHPHQPHPLPLSPVKQQGAGDPQQVSGKGGDGGKASPDPVSNGANIVKGKEKESDETTNDGSAYETPSSVDNMTADGAVAGNDANSGTPEPPVKDGLDERFPIKALKSPQKKVKEKNGSDGEKDKSEEEENPDSLGMIASEVPGVDPMKPGEEHSAENEPVATYSSSLGQSPLTDLQAKIVEAIQHVCETQALESAGIEDIVKYVGNVWGLLRKRDGSFYTGDCKPAVTSSLTTTMHKRLFTKHQSKDPSTGKKVVTWSVTPLAASSLALFNRIRRVSNTGDDMVLGN